MTVIGTAEIDVRGRTTGFTKDVEQGVGGKVSALAGSIQGKLLGALGVGAVIKGIGTIGIAYQDSLNTFSAVADKAQLTAAGGLDAVGDAAIRLGNNLELPNTSAADAAGAMTELAKAGLSVHDTMGAALGTLQLATAATVDEAEAAKITANALNTFHLEGSKAADVANVLANAANVSSGEVTDFAMGLAQGGLAAKNAGLSISETAGALALFANNGLRGSDAGTSLKTMLQRLVPTSKTAANAMKGLGLDFTDAHGRFLPLDQVAQQLHDHLGNLTQAERAHQLQLIFGSDAVRAATLLYDAGSEGVDHYTNAVDRAGGVQAIAAAKAKGLGGAFRGFQSQAETLALTIFNDVAPSLEDLVRGASTLMPTISNVAHIAGQVLGPALGLVADTLSEVGHVIGAVTGFFRDHEGVATALAVVLTASLIPALVRSAAAASARAYEALAVGMYKTTISAGVLAKSFNPITAAATVAAIGVGLMWEHDKKVAAEAKQAADDYVTSLHVLPSSLASITAALEKFKSGAAITDVMVDPDVHGANGAIEAFKELARQYDQLQAKATAVRTNESALEDQFGLTQSQVESLAAANDIDLSGSLSTLTSRMGAAITANERSHHPLQQARDDVKDLGTSSSSAADDVKALTSALDLLAGDALSADQQTIAFRNDIDALDKALKKSNGSLDLSGKASRAARDAFDSAAQQAISAAEAQAKLSNGTNRARQTLQDEIQTLKEHGGNSDYAKAAIGRLEKALDQIPGAALRATSGLKRAGDAAHGIGVSIGDDLGAGLIEGLNAMIPHATIAGKILVQQTAKAMRLAAETGSPSKVTRRIGLDMGAGLEDGVLLSTPAVVAAATALTNAVASAVALGLSSADMGGAISRSIRTATEQAERDRDAAVRHLTNARDKAAESAGELSVQADIYQPLRASANAAAHEVKRLQNAIDAEVHSAHPNEKRIRALRQEQDEARRTAESTDRMADHAQKAYDRASERADKWAKRVQEDSKAVRQAQRELADAFRQEQVDAASAVLDALSAEVDALVAQADALKGAFADAILSGTSLQSILAGLTTTDEEGNTIAPADPVGSFIASLQSQLTTATSFATDVGALVAANLNEGTINEIIKLGPVAGDAFAQALLAAGPDAITAINDLMGAINTVAFTGVDHAANQLFGPGAAQLAGLIAGIRSGFPELDATIDEINAKLATIGVGSAAVAAVTAGPSAPASALLTRAASTTIAPVTKVTVEGNADADTVRALETWARDYNATLVQVAQTGVKP